MSLRCLVLSVLGIKDRPVHAIVPMTDVHHPGGVDLSHNKAVHDLHNVEMKAMAVFESAAIRSRRASAVVRLGEAAEHMKREINEDAERTRAALGQAVHRQK